MAWDSGIGRITELCGPWSRQQTDYKRNTYKLQHMHTSDNVTCPI